MSLKEIFLLLATAGLCLSACAAPGYSLAPGASPLNVPGHPTLTPPTQTLRPPSDWTATQQPSQTPPLHVSQPTKVWTATLLPSPSGTATPAPTQAATPSQTMTIEPTPSVNPTASILRGVVIPEKVSCRYGPGAMYLYLYGMVSGAVQDIIGRTDSGAWVLSRAHGDNKACWVKTDLMKIEGDVMSLEVVYPDKYRLPPSNQGYRSPWDVAAIRSGSQVVISWKSEALRPGDEESATSVLYVVETWVCRSGQLLFDPIGAYSPQVTVIDEPGCSQPSHGRVYFSEKHGYAGPSEITWPVP